MLLDYLVPDNTTLHATPAALSPASPQLSNMASSLSQMSWRRQLVVVVVAATAVAVASHLVFVSADSDGRVPQGSARSVTAFVQARAGSCDILGAAFDAAHCLAGQQFTCSMRSGIVPGGAAWGTVNDTMDSTGWIQLEIHSASANASAGLSELAVAFAVGCVEGHLTQVETCYLASLRTTCSPL